MRGSASVVLHGGILVLPDIIFYFSFKRIDFSSLLFQEEAVAPLLHSVWLRRCSNSEHWVLKPVCSQNGVRSAVGPSSSKSSASAEKREIVACHSLPGQLGDWAQESVSLSTCWGWSAFLPNRAAVAGLLTSQLQSNQHRKVSKSATAKTGMLKAGNFFPSMCEQSTLLKTGPKLCNPEQKEAWQRLHSSTFAW